MTRTAQRIDAVVVGGGPAGSAAVAVLASSGRRSPVLERGARIVTENGGRSREVDFANSPEVAPPATCQVPRARLDELPSRHAEASGAEVIEEAPVETVEPSDDGVLHTSEGLATARADAPARTANDLGSGHPASR